ncbi:MAG: hypothetical protein WCP29_07890 [Acidobacteriota bacterium]
MRELLKATITLPWALSMVGVQQLANLVSAPADGRVADAAATLDAMTAAASHHVDGWLDQALDLGGAVQRGLADLTAMRPPSVDASGLMRVATDPRWAAVFQATSEFGLGPVARLDALRVASDHREAALQECLNKLHVLRLLTQVYADLGLDTANHDALPVLIDRAASLQPFPRLWAIEAIGREYGDWALAAGDESGPMGVLTDAWLDQLPAWSLTMLHAGLGLSFAASVLAAIEPSSSLDLVRHLVTHFADLCRRSSRRGYAGAALGSLGVVARMLHRDLMPLLARTIPQVEPDLHAYFWHGAGRAMYLDPDFLLPSSNAPVRVITTLKDEAPDEASYRQALAGMSWTMTLVNMPHPEVIALFLSRQKTLASAADVFATGVWSALLVRHDTTPGDARIRSFIEYQPQDADVAALWHSQIASSCRLALDRRYDHLKQTWALQDLFSYRPGVA